MRPAMRTVSGSRRGERIASTASRGDVRSSKVQKRRRVADRALRVGERDRVAQRRVGVAVAVRRPHAAAARPRSRGPGYIAATLATRGRTRSAPSSFFAPSLSRRLRDSARHVFGVRGWRATPRVAFVLSRALWPSRASRRDFGSQGSRSGVRPSSGGGRVCFL